MNPRASIDAVIGSLVFKFGIQEVALEGMEHFGDTESALFFLAIKSRLQASGAFPDLSQELPSGVLDIRPTATEALASLSDLISAYDAARLDPRRNSRIQLRRTIEAVYELVDTLREQQISDSEAKDCLSKESLLNKSFECLPLRPGQIKSLNVGGFKYLKDIFGLGRLDIMGRCGLTDRQVEAIDEIITNYVIVSVRLDDMVLLPFLRQVGVDIFGCGFQLVDLAAQEAVDQFAWHWQGRFRSGLKGWEVRASLLERNEILEEEFRTLLESVASDFAGGRSSLKIESLAKDKTRLAYLPNWSTVWGSDKACRTV